jgi:hypothetical protein
VTDTESRAHISQPGLSRVLARIDQEDGAAVFQRVAGHYA